MNVVCRMADKQGSVKINCVLTGETAQKFNEIKKAVGVQQKTEVVRVMIKASHGILTTKEEL
jgi:predicted LPLAT superfamily acyltransferase